MKAKPYPVIPNTEFRSIPKNALNINSEFEHPLDRYSDDLFHGYAITNHKEIWYGRGMPWHKVDLFVNHEGTTTIALVFFDQPGQIVVPIDMLFDYVFGNK